MREDFDHLLARVRACTLCRDHPLYAPPLPHEARPVLQATPSARVCIIGQAPGTRVHVSGKPYTDRSGDRLRDWLGVGERQFYDADRIAIVPMGFCFPGNDTQGGDLPPRRECAPTWHGLIMERLQQVELMLLVGGYAHKRYLERSLVKDGVSGTVAQWRLIYESSRRPKLFPLPHPSWRNTRWLQDRPWFAAELLPVLQAAMRTLLISADDSTG